VIIMAYPHSIASSFGGSGAGGEDFHPLQWVRARWNGDTRTGRVCCAIIDGAGDRFYEVELPEVIGKGGTHVRVMRAAKELEALPETADC
jgi:hypothetical protein